MSLNRFHDLFARSALPETLFVMISEQTRGIVLASGAGLCWGCMSVAAQYLFTDLGFSPEDLVSLRLLASGALLIAIDFLLNPRNVVAPVFRRENLPAVLLYGAGVLSGQYTFFLSIAHTNAGTAAILIGTQPLMILLWLAFHDGRHITPREGFCLLLALFGVGCLVTKGDLSSLDFSAAGVVFGLLSAASGAFSTIQPRNVLRRIGAGLTAGWGLFAGGCIMTVFNPPWAARVAWTWETVAACFVVILIGTVVAFWCYLASTKYVSPAVTGLLVSFEPLSAVVLSALLLGVTFGAWELAGAGAILANLVLLSLRRSR